MRYKDKVTIVTGGSKGIGAGCVKSLWRRAGPRSSSARATRPKGGPSRPSEPQVARLGRVHPGRRLKVEDIKKVIDFTAESFGRIDCLINNAGWHPPHK